MWFCAEGRMRSGLTSNADPRGVEPGAVSVP